MHIDYYKKHLHTEGYKKFNDTGLLERYIEEVLNTTIGLQFDHWPSIIYIAFRP